MPFVGAGFIEAGTLRQGDIIRDVPLVGSLCFKEVAQHSSIAGGNAQKSWSVHSDLKVANVAVLSFCCEIEKSNGVKLTSIVLAPVRDVSGATAPDKLEELIGSNVIADGAEFSYLKYFYLAPEAFLPYKLGSIIDFSKIFSVRKTSYDYLLERKVAQMDDETRTNMALKLGLYFYRYGPLPSSQAA